MTGRNNPVLDEHSYSKRAACHTTPLFFNWRKTKNYYTFITDINNYISHYNDKQLSDHRTQGCSQVFGLSTMRVQGSDPSTDKTLGDFFPSILALVDRVTAVAGGRCSMYPVELVEVHEIDERQVARTLHFRTRVDTTWLWGPCPIWSSNYGTLTKVNWDDFYNQFKS